MTITHIITDDDGKVKCIIVKFDDDKAGLQQQSQYPHFSENYKDEIGTPIFRQKLQYCISNSKSWKQSHAAKATHHFSNIEGQEDMKKREEPGGQGPGHPLPQLGLGYHCRDPLQPSLRFLYVCP